MSALTSKQRSAIARKGGLARAKKAGAAGMSAMAKASHAGLDLVKAGDAVSLTQVAGSIALTMGAAIGREVAARSAPVQPPAPVLLSDVDRGAAYLSALGVPVAPDLQAALARVAEVTASRESVPAYLAQLTPEARDLLAQVAARESTTPEGLAVAHLKRLLVAEQDRRAGVQVRKHKLCDEGVLKRVPPGQTTPNLVRLHAAVLSALTSGALYVYLHKPSGVVKVAASFDPRDAVESLMISLKNEDRFAPGSDQYLRDEAGQVTLASVRARCLAQAVPPAEAPAPTKVEVIS